jgi:hypothetical protein
MSGRLRSFDVLCGCLADGTAANTGDLRAALSDARLDWRRVIEAAAEHYVLPLLWCRLAERDLVAAVPPLVAELLADLHARNVARNERLRLQLIEIGAAVLVAPAATRDARMLLDIDVLVPAAALDAAVAALHAIGYRPLAAAHGTGFHHPPLHKPGTLATVELHTALGEQTHILAAADAIAHATPVLPGLIAPSPTHRLVHNVFHAAGQNHGGALAVGGLKDLCDFITIAGADAGAIDWAEVRRRYAGQPALLDSQVNLAARLLGWTPPAALGTGWRRRAAYRRYRLHLRVPALWHATGLWAAATYPLRRSRIEYAFGPCAGPAALARARLRLLWRLLRRRGSATLGARLARTWAHYRHHQAARRW